MSQKLPELAPPLGSRPPSPPAPPVELRCTWCGTKKVQPWGWCRACTDDVNRGAGQ